MDRIARTNEACISKHAPENSLWSSLKTPTIIATTATSVSTLVTALGVKLVGFGSIGIIPLSKAAIIQSSIGNVPAGCLFAKFTTIGMSSLLPFAITTGVITGGVSVGGYYGYKSLTQERVPIKVEYF